MPTVLQYPPPWTLRGRGIVICHRARRGWRQRYDTGSTGPVALTMWVDYVESPVGPYREWLMVPGKVPNPRGKHYSIGDIFVDSTKSLVGGQQNWGIPKALGDFEFETRDGQVGASLSFDRTRLELNGRTAGPAFPVTSAWWSPTLVQQRDGQFFWTRPGMRGRCRWLRIHRNTQSGDGVPDITGENVLVALYAEQFEMTFPPAEIAAGYRGA